MSLDNDKLCKGCICQTCRNSEYNGALFACTANGCGVCNDEAYFKLQTCAVYVPLQEESADDLRL